MPTKKPPPRPPRPGKPRNPFGDPADTVYAGGTPLFDEATGRTVTRRQYQRRRPPAR